MCRRLERIRLDYGYRHDPMLRGMVDLVAPDSVILDVGAGFGLYTLVLAERRPRSRIWAFEPSPDTFEKLTRCVELHPASSRVRCLPLAIGATRESHMPFHLSSDPGRSSLRAFNARRGDGHVSGTVEVACDSIDNLVRDGVCAAPDAIKIDVEGYEYEVVLGAERTIATYRPIVCFESHARDDGFSNAPAILERLADVGYVFESHEDYFLGRCTGG